MSNIPLHSGLIKHDGKIKIRNWVFNNKDNYSMKNIPKPLNKKAYFFLKTSRKSNTE